MTESAFVLGGTGLIGRALVPRLLGDGYAVTVGSRNGGSDDDAVTHVRVDRDRDEEFDASIRGEYDVFVDVIAYNRQHAEQLQRLRGRIGSLVVISSAAVYADTKGQMLLGSSEGSGVPITEKDRVVDPVGDGSDYAGGKVAVERLLLEAEPAPVTILRPGAIFGPGDRASREWHFVKRVLDDRPFVPLAYNGESLFHHVSSTNVAEMTLLAAQRPKTRLVNCGDPHPMNVRQIADAVSVHLDHDWEIVALPGPPQGEVGATPWTTPNRFLLDLTVAERELGFTGALHHRAALGETIEWLVSETSGRAWQDVLPAAAHNYSSLFDYQAEDRFIEELRRQ